MENEDELLLALAGLKQVKRFRNVMFYIKWNIYVHVLFLPILVNILLKALVVVQVRDVMKGTLKPSSLHDEEEISIRDDHYSKPVSYSRQDSREDMLSSEAELSPDAGDTGVTNGKASTSEPKNSLYSSNRPMNESFTSTDSMGGLDSAAGGMIPNIDGLTGVERHLMKREIELHDIRMQEERERESMEKRLADLARQEREEVLHRMSSGEWSSPGSDSSPNGKTVIHRQQSDHAIARQPVLGAGAPVHLPPTAGRVDSLEEKQNTTIKPASLPVTRNPRPPSNSGSRRSSRDSSPMEKISGLFRSIKF